MDASSKSPTPLGGAAIWQNSCLQTRFPKTDTVSTIKRKLATRFTLITSIEAAVNSLLTGGPTIAGKDAIVSLFTSAQWLDLCDPPKKGKDVFDAPFVPLTKNEILYAWDVTTGTSDEYTQKRQWFKTLAPINLANIKERPTSDAELFEAFRFISTTFT